ncbi:alpha/beta hydrolase [Candidatus Pacearchaeota archaeon]|nr:alpha/beta hydrolase [Candidatus Pacearchaeota archaeon]
MKRINKIKKLGLVALLAEASIFSSKAFAQDPYIPPKKLDQEINIPYLQPITYTPKFEDRNENRNFVIVHGLNQTSAAWANSNQTMQNKGFQTQIIDLPNRGHNGSEQNKIAINNTVGNIQGKNNVFGGYSTGGVSMLRYMQENPKFIENNKGSTIILLDPAIKLNAPLEVLASAPMRPIVAPITGKLNLSQTEKELTRQDTNKFIDTTLAGMPKLAENLAKNNWNVHVIVLNGEVVNGGSVKSMAETFKAHNVNVYQHTPADIMNNYTSPTIGNKGNFLGGDMTALKVPTPEFKRDSSSHFIWSNTYKLGIDKFVTDIASTPMQSAKLSDILSSSGVLQNYPVLKDTQLQITGSLSEQLRTATISPELVKMAIPAVDIKGDINYVPRDIGKTIELNPNIADYGSILKDHGKLNVVGGGVYGGLNNGLYNNPNINNGGLQIRGNNNYSPRR